MIIKKTTLPRHQDLPVVRSWMGVAAIFVFQTLQVISAFAQRDCSWSLAIILHAKEVITDKD